MKISCLATNKFRDYFHQEFPWELVEHIQEQRLLFPIFFCHKIKDGGYNKTNMNKLSPTQNMSTLQARAILFVSGAAVEFMPSLCLALVKMCLWLWHDHLSTVYFQTFRLKTVSEFFSALHVSNV